MTDLAALKTTVNIDQGIESNKSNQPNCDEEPTRSAQELAIIKKTKHEAELAIVMTLQAKELSDARAEVDRLKEEMEKMRTRNASKVMALAAQKERLEKQVGELTAGGCVKGSLTGSSSSGSALRNLLTTPPAGATGDFVVEKQQQKQQEKGVVRFELHEITFAMFLFCLGCALSHACGNGSLPGSGKSS